MTLQVNISCPHLRPFSHCVTVNPARKQTTRIPTPGTVHHTSITTQLTMYSNQLVGGRYRTSNEVGKGAFARVYRAFDTHSNQAVALKILKREYAMDAMREVNVLKAMNRNDPDQVQRVCRMQANFTWEGQPCLIFNLYGPALRSRSFGSGNKQELAKLTKQLCTALDFLHYTCRIVHTDLKPEVEPRHLPSPPPLQQVTRHTVPQSTTEHPARQPQPQLLGSRRRLGHLRPWQVCLTHAGRNTYTHPHTHSASAYKERPDKELITTRPYRAPEVVTVSGWSHPSDMFSIGYA